MNIAWFTPFSNKSAIGKVSKKICEEMIKLCNVDIWTHDLENLIETDVNVNSFNQKTSADELKNYDYIIYNIGNYAAFHKDIYEMSQKKPGVMLLHDQTMYSFWAEYCLMPQFGLDSREGFQKYTDMFRRYYGEAAEALAVEAIQSGYAPIYEYKNMPDYKLVEPVIKDSVGVFTHAKFFTDRIKEIYNGPIGYSYLPCEEEAHVNHSSKVVSDIIKNAKNENKLIILSNGMVQRLKRIDKVANVLRKNKKLSKQVCYIVIGSYHGEYGEGLEQLSNKELKGCLYMLGFQNDDEMNYALQNVDLCINLRYPNSEVCSLSLFEQMASGKPTIVLNSGIYGEMPDNSVIKISLDQEENDLENALLRILDNKELYREYGKNAKSFIDKYCNTKVYCENLLDFLKNLNKNKHIALLQNRLINETGYLLKKDNFTNESVPSTVRNMINQIGNLFEQQKPITRRNKVIGVWAGFLYQIPNLRRKYFSRLMVYIIKLLMKNYPICVEVWSYSINVEEMKDSFSSMLSDELYLERIKFITEKNWDQYFTPNPENLSYEKEVNEHFDNLCDLARDYSEANCFLPMALYLDNVIGTEKPIFVPAHDMEEARCYYNSINKDPLYNFKYLDIKSRAENLVRNGATIFLNCNTVRQTQILRYIKNLREDKTVLVHLPVNNQEGIEDNTCDIDLFLPLEEEELAAKEYYNLFFHEIDLEEATKNEI